HVALTGNNTDGLSLANAFTNLQELENNLTTDHFTNGDCQVYVHGGVYSIPSKFDGSSYTPGPTNRLIISPWVGETVTLSNNNNVLYVNTGLIEVQGIKDVVIEGLKFSFITASPSYGVFLNSATNVLVQNCYFGSNNTGILVSPITAVSNTIYSNNFYSNQTGIISLGTSTIIISNTLANHPNRTIDLQYPLDNQLSFNLLYNSTLNGIGIFMDSASNGNNSIHYNTISNFSTGLLISGNATNIIEYNNFVGNNQYINLGSNPGTVLNNYWGTTKLSDIILHSSGVTISDVVPYYLSMIDITKSDVIPPAAPTNLSFTGTAGQIVISWDADVDAVSYRVFRSAFTNAYTNFTTNYAEVSQHQFTDTAVNPGTNYYYFVTARDVSGNESFYSASLLAYLDSTPPQIVLNPASLNATNAITNVITASDDKAGVRIHYSVVQTNFIDNTPSYLIFQTNLLTNIFTPDTQNPFYIVRAFAEDLAGNISAETNAVYYLDPGIAPAVTLIPDYPGLWVTNETFPVSWTSEGGSLSISFTTNGSPFWSVLPSAYCYYTNRQISSEGTNTFIFYATNLISLNGSSVQTNRYLLDSQPPLVTITPAAATQNSVLVSIQVFDYSGFTLNYSLARDAAIEPDTVTTTNITLLLTDTLPADWYLVTEAFDSLGHTNTRKTNVYTLTAGDPGLSVFPALTQSIIYSSSNLTYNYSTGNGDLIWAWFTNGLAASSGTSAGGYLAEFNSIGTNLLIVFASNTSDGSVTSNTTNRVVIDPEAPVLSYLPASETSYTGSVNFSLLAQDNWSPVSLYYSLQWDSVPLTNLELSNAARTHIDSSSFTVNLSPDNQSVIVSLLAYAVDAAGNQSAWVFPWYQVNPATGSQSAYFSSNPYRVGEGDLVISVKNKNQSRISVRIYDITQALRAELTDYSTSSDSCEFIFQGSGLNGQRLGRGVYLVVPVYDGVPDIQSVRKLYLLTR
ncbi:MAG: right-handed parallel beta-helix repeat-containing protein, partial [Sedimentisphaerales bacterium]|nr:right-handed parallel beta-helix repeat-containing protein [Sedimentisphaerales bacterium]